MRSMVALNTDKIFKPDTRHQVLHTLAVKFSVSRSKVGLLVEKLRVNTQANIVSADDLTFDLKWYHLNVYKPARRKTHR